MKSHPHHLLAMRFLSTALTVVLPYATSALPVAAVIVAGVVSQAEGASNTRKLLQRARSGDVDAMRYLARTLWDGSSPHGRDRQLAIQWWKKAAQKGDDKSMVILGQLYESGNCVRKDADEAMEYYERAAENGNKTAKKKIFSALQAKVLKGDDADLQYELAQCYEEGKGTEINAEEAHKWYRKAAENGHSGARRKIFSRVQEAAETGDSLAMLELAEMYEHGKFTYPDKDAALKWYRKAAESGGFREAHAAIKRLQEEKNTPDPYQDEENIDMED